MLKLRKWQSKSINQALSQYLLGQIHFLCLATPGAGKTLMASVLAKQLFDQKLIDLVVCFSPSLIVSNDFRDEIQNQTEKRLDGKLGANGCSITYQAMLTLEQEFWGLFEQYRTFVIFDEIHHCAGSDIFNANAWGEIIISRIQSRAAYTLALTGTPWRSDSIPIALSQYKADDNKIHCDFQYGLSNAIKDGVCRTPRLILIDNDNIKLHTGKETKHYRSFAELLEQTDCSYQQVIENEALITYTLSKANKKLGELRSKFPDAGGLIVAASVAHARGIKAILRTKIGEEAAIATYQEEDALSVINEFKYNRTKWIISVGMISEGTNIPRLRVCCHLSRVKTELYFRQILGRILRANNLNEEGFLYMPAEPSLINYAHQLAEDIPSSNVIKTDVMKKNSRQSKKNKLANKGETGIDLVLNVARSQDKQAGWTKNFPIEKSTLSDSYEKTIGIFGRFKQEMVSFNSVLATNSQQNV